MSPVSLILKLPNTVKVGESICYNLPVVQYSPKASAGVVCKGAGDGV